MNVYGVISYNEGYYGILRQGLLNYSASIQRLNCCARCVVSNFTSSFSQSDPFLLTNTFGYVLTNCIYNRIYSTTEIHRSLRYFQIISYKYCVISIRCKCYFPFSMSVTVDARTIAFIYQLLEIGYRSIISCNRSRPLALTSFLLYKTAYAVYY